MIVLAGLPLKLRARLTAALGQVELARNESDLFQALSHHPRALVLQEGLGSRPLLELLGEVRGLFGGPLLLIVRGAHSPQEMHALLGTGRVTQMFHHPAAPEDLLRSLTLEAGATSRAEEAGPPLESLSQLWHESLPLLREWLRRLEAAFEPQRSPEQLEQARQAAHYLAGNLGTFGLPQATLLAREAERLLERAVEGESFSRLRLEQVIANLQQLSQQAHPYRARRPRAIVVVSQASLLEEIDLEARLLHWEIEVCDDLRRLPERLAHESSRVVVLEAEAEACRRSPEQLDELLRDPYPKVVLTPPSGDGSIPESQPHCRYLALPQSGYQVMMAVLRSQLTPSLDNPPYILVLDDDRIARKVIEHALNQVDFHVETLESPLRLWEELERARPDLIMLDIELPNISGIELCRALRMDERYRAIPIMFLSSYADSRTVHRAYEAGADDYLFKPVVPHELRIRVSNRLERCQQLRRQEGAPAHGPARTYSSLDQLLLRAGREEVPLGLALIVPGCEAQALESLVRQLRSHLRGEDLVKYLSPTELLVAALAQDPEALSRRLGSLLPAGCPWGLAWLPQDGSELEKVIAVARQRVAGRSVAEAGQQGKHESTGLDRGAGPGGRRPADSPTPGVNGPDHA